MTPLQKKVRRIALFAGPLVALSLLLSLQLAGITSAIAWTSAVTTWCVIWWVMEPVPIPVTSMLPLSLFPFVGVLSASQVGEAYGSKLVLLLLGGLILSTAMSHSGAHRRIALFMVNLFGGQSPKRLVFGFMTAAAVLSMWISNTATTLMLLPVALAVLESSSNKKLAVPLLLGIAYASNVGGIGTPIGTPPNLIFMQVFHENTDEHISFLQWMMWGVPVVILMVPLMALWLTRHLGHEGKFDLPTVGAWSTHEKRVLQLFAVTALLWVTRQEPFGGWSAWLNLPKANDASIALFATIAMFVIPNGKGEKLLSWKAAEHIPWGMLLLFGGGICLAKAFVVSGLSTILGDAIAGVTAFPIIVTIGIIALTVSFMTETTSNTASTTLLMPILAAAALGVNIELTILMVPAAMAASCAFMLPVATAPNTVVFSSGLIPIRTMAREGVILNFLGVIIITAVCVVTLL